MKTKPRRLCRSLFTLTFEQFDAFSQAHLDKIKFQIPVDVKTTMQLGSGDKHSK